MRDADIKNSDDHIQCNDATVDDCSGLQRKKYRHKCRIKNFVTWLWRNNNIFDYELVERKW